HLTGVTDAGEQRHAGNVLQNLGQRIQGPLLWKCDRRRHDSSPELNELPGNVFHDSESNNSGQQQRGQHCPTIEREPPTRSWSFTFYGHAISFLQTTCSVLSLVSPARRAAGVRICGIADAHSPTITIEGAGNGAC